jgi:hypothetical protein
MFYRTFSNGRRPSAYKQTDAPLLIALPLLLTVVGCRIGMGQPVVLLIVGMSVTPLPPAVADHSSVFRIGQALLAPVIVTPLGLTLRPTANGLVGRCLEGWKACWQYGQQRGGKINSSEVCLGPNLEEIRSGGAPQTI